MLRTLYCIIFFGTFFFSCEKLLIKKNPNTSYHSILEEYAKLVEEKYSMIDTKGIDIQKLKNEVANQITKDDTDITFFQKLSHITLSLKDGHCTLDASKQHFGLIAYHDSRSGYPIVFNTSIIQNYYLNPMSNPTVVKLNGNKLMFGIIERSSKKIGYINIPSFNASIEESEIENMFAYVKNTAGLIVDVRQNGGGKPILASKIAGYMTNKKIYVGFERFKTGPHRNDFSSSRIYLTPSGSPNTYTKPIIILMDRGSFSAALTFIYLLNPIENITLMGQRAGGGSGSFADGFLSNGWKWTLSTSEFVDLDGNHLDDGIEPDIKVTLTSNSVRIDKIIESAIQQLL